MKTAIFTLVTAAALLATPALAEKKFDMKTSSNVPAAQGRATIEHDRNKNVKVTLEVEHLAKPQSLAPAKGTYVVWIQPEGQEPNNVGVLRVNDELKGDFRTTTPYKKFDLFVTAEDSPTVSSPSGTEIMRQQLQDKE
jgi:hypothetical protein